METRKIGNVGFGGAGASGAARSGTDATYKELWLAARAELDDLRAQFAALTAKLDADTGVTDTDYAATLALDDKQFVA